MSSVSKLVDKLDSSTVCVSIVDEWSMESPADLYHSPSLNEPLQTLALTPTLSTKHRQPRKITSTYFSTMYNIAYYDDVP